MLSNDSSSAYLDLIRTHDIPFCSLSLCWVDVSLLYTCIPYSYYIFFFIEMEINFISLLRYFRKTNSPQGTGIICEHGPIDFYIN